MTNIPMREIRNHTASVLERVRCGEEITITSNGVPVAALVPLATRKPSSFSRGELEIVLMNQADSAMAGELENLAEYTTLDPDAL